MSCWGSPAERARKERYPQENGGLPFLSLLSSALIFRWETLLARPVWAYLTSDFLTLEGLKGSGGWKGCEDTYGEIIGDGDFSMDQPRLGVGVLAGSKMMSR